MLRVAVLDDYTGKVPESADWTSLAAIAQVDFYRDHLEDEAAIAARLAPYDVVVGERERTPFPASLLHRLPNLRLLVTTGPVNWRIDLAAAAAQGITVSCTDAQQDSTPELVWALILGLTRRIVSDDRLVRAGGWQDGLPVGVLGKRLGLIGLGQVGSRAARIAQAFGMEVVAWSQNMTEAQARESGAKLVGLDTLLRSSDVVSLHVVLSDRTRGLIGRRELALMRPDAFLVNTARGPVVDETALIEALAEKRIAGAGIDVFDREPLPADHPFRKLENCIVTPHTGYITVDQYRLFYGQVVDSIRAFATGAPVRILTMS